MVSLLETLRNTSPLSAHDYVPTRAPVRLDDGTVSTPRALEVAYDFSAQWWEKINKIMSERIDCSNVQMLIIPHAHDFSLPLTQSLRTDHIGPYPPGSLHRNIWPDGEMHVSLEGVQPHMDHTYVIASPTETNTLFELVLALDTLKGTYQTKLITLICPFLTGGRGDKNIGNDGRPLPLEAMNIRTIMGMLGPYVDRMMVFEPHSSATQAFAAQNGIPLVPFSLGSVLLKHVMNSGVAKTKGGVHKLFPSPENCVLIRPDEGRNRSLTLIREESGFPSVGFDKRRLTGDSVQMNGLSPADIDLIQGRIGLGYDDEYSTGATLNAILDELQKYGLPVFGFMTAHLKGPHDPSGQRKDWRTRMHHPILTTVAATNSRAPVGEFYNPETNELVELAEDIEIVSLVGFIRQIVEADMRGVNFWTDPQYSKLILQDH